jgi:hypothetical protein
VIAALGTKLAGRSPSVPSPPTPQAEEVTTS